MSYGFENALGAFGEVCYPGGGDGGAEDEFTAFAAANFDDAAFATTTTTKSGYFEACTRSPFSDGTGRKDFDPAVQSARVRQGGRREH